MYTDEVLQVSVLKELGLEFETSTIKSINELLAQASRGVNPARKFMAVLQDRKSC